MRIDCHIHTRPDFRYMIGGKFDQKAFLADLRAANMDGGCIYSLSPTSYPEIPAEERMQYALDVCEGCDTLFPFFWIDPLEKDALQQVDLAVEKGFAAFKMIPTTYRVDCPEAMAVLGKIAETGKPVMFHSGICWDGIQSGENNKPVIYEAMLKIPRLRFCLAHVSWPWYDECIALYGKMQYAYRKNPETTCEMFIDVTPGTPVPYREEVFRHLLLSYDMRNKLMFGSDCNTGDYAVEPCLGWQRIDDALYEKYVSGDVEDFKARVYGGNLLRFLGIGGNLC